MNLTTVSHEKEEENQVTTRILFPLGHKHPITLMQHLHHRDIYLGLTENHLLAAI